MTTSLLSPSQKTRREPMVSAQRVKEMLLELAFRLHATRVVGKRGNTGEPRRPQKG